MLSLFDTDVVKFQWIISTQNDRMWVRKNLEFMKAELKMEQASLMKHGCWEIVSNNK